jgi:hypothetical protein
MADTKKNQEAFPQHKNQKKALDFLYSNIKINEKIEKIQFSICEEEKNERKARIEDLTNLLNMKIQGLLNEKSHGSVAYYVAPYYLLRILTMLMQFNEKLKLYEYGDDYIENYIQSNQSKAWNSSQLNVILEIIVSFINYAIQVLVENPNKAKQLFYYLHEINNAPTYEASDPARKQLVKHISEIENMYAAKGGIILYGKLPYILQLCMKIFNRELKLEKFQSRYYYTAEQKEEVKDILNAHLNEAINCLNKSTYSKKQEDTKKPISNSSYNLFPSDKSSNLVPSKDNNLNKHSAKAQPKPYSR